MKRRTEHLRGGRRQDDDEYLRADGDDGAVEERAPEDGIPKDGRVVVQPRPPEGEAPRRGGAEAEHDRQHERDAHEEDDVAQCRGEHHHPQDVFAVGELHRRLAPVAASKEHRARSGTANGSVSPSGIAVPTVAGSFAITVASPAPASVTVPYT